MGPRQSIADQLLVKAGVTRAMHERVQLFQDPQTEFALLRTALAFSRINNITRVHGHAISQEKRAADIYDAVGQWSRERLFRDSRRKVRSKRHLTQASPGGYERARDIAGPAHFGTLMAATPRILAMIQDAVTAGLLPKQPSETHLGEDQATAKFYIQKAAWAADEAWQQTAELHNRPVVTNPTVCQNSNIPVRPLKMMTMRIWDFSSAPRPEPTQCTAVPSAAFTVL